MRASLLAALSLGVCAVPADAIAQDGGAARKGMTLSAQADAETAGSHTLGTTGSPFAVAAVSDSQLSTIAGRENTTQISQNEQFAGVADNSVGDNVVTGDARISDRAFQNMSGLSILNVNTGNNVAINASMNVNVSISPVP